MAEHMSELMTLLEGREHIVLLAGLGCVTGTWASQYLCEQLKLLGKKVVILLVKLFNFEGEKVTIAEASLEGFNSKVHRIPCSNDDLKKLVPSDTSLTDAFTVMNEKAFDLVFKITQEIFMKIYRAQKPVCLAYHGGTNEKSTF